MLIQKIREANSFSSHVLFKYRNKIYDSDLCRAYFGPGTVIGTPGIWMNKIDKKLYIWGAYFLTAG